MAITRARNEFDIVNDVRVVHFDSCVGVVVNAGNGGDNATKGGPSSPQSFRFNLATNGIFLFTIFFLVEFFFDIIRTNFCSLYLKNAYIGEIWSQVDYNDPLRAHVSFI